MMVSSTYLRFILDFPRHSV